MSLHGESEWLLSKSFIALWLVADTAWETQSRTLTWNMATTTHRMFFFVLSTVLGTWGNLQGNKPDTIPDLWGLCPSEEQEWGPESQEQMWWAIHKIYWRARNTVRQRRNWAGWHRWEGHFRVPEASVHLKGGNWTRWKTWREDFSRKKATDSNNRDYTSPQKGA